MKAMTLNRRHLFGLLSAAAVMPRPAVAAAAVPISSAVVPGVSIGEVYTFAGVVRPDGQLKQFVVTATSRPTLPLGYRQR